MAVVINELEVAPSAAATSGQEPQGQKQQGSSSQSPEAIKTMEKALHRKHQRNHRLEAY